MSAQAIKIESVGQLDTTDNAFHNLTTVTTSDNGSGGLQAVVAVRRTSDGASQTWFIIGQYKTINGTVTANFGKVGTTIGASADKTALNNTDIQFTNDGNNIQLQCKGLTGTALAWSAVIEGIEVVNL